MHQKTLGTARRRILKSPQRAAAAIRYTLFSWLFVTVLIYRGCLQAYVSYLSRAREMVFLTPLVTIHS
ncbi:hypothetical protein BOTBODRAFT_296819 [Botryobasidium botryosum FD-172 SS1]|uniref:Uncharacterized protein n=1 Tax=Botryobasidium botryosum (strain FD-172 SS1) TaxID=930990 RepID=A0A067MKK3_BOTB1|nr:hypothetical protein BOTBODRAFT_296819 [Botryobasidium botryosum FD-172 SS1]